MRDLADKRMINRYIMLILALGASSLLYAFARLPSREADWNLLMIAVFTLILGSRITLQIPRFKSHVTVSDTLIFLTFILYGGEYAIVLAAAEAFVSSWQFCNRKVTVFFNSAAAAISTGSVFLVLTLAGLTQEHQLRGHQGYTQDFVIALSIMALVQFAVTTSIATAYDALKSSLLFWETWKSNYLWTFLTYFIGVASAGALVQLSDTAGFGMILATLPVILFVFFTYRMYLKNVEISIRQKEQAEQYADAMQAQSQALRESEERFRSAFDYAPIGIGLVSPSGRWLKVNFALKEILGYSQEEFLASDFQSMVSPEYLGFTLVKVHETLCGKIASSQMEQRYIHKTGRNVWTSWSVSAAHDSGSDQPNLIFQIQDITDKKTVEEKLHFDATHDALTGLPNRAFFMAKLNEAIERAADDSRYKVSVLFIDLDRFKYVNDSLGHLMGDKLLMDISLRLKECLRPNDVVARLGGDEFTILVEGRQRVDEVSQIAERIQGKFEVPFDLAGSQIYSSASIGILNVGPRHKDSADVLRDADTAMYHAKKAGKARHAVFDDRMHNAAREILQLETDLRHCVENDEISVLYQPIFDLDTEQITGVEALARWQHPELGMISPSKFIPLAEEIGLINRLSERVLSRACGDIGSIHREGYDLPLSVNLSCKQFASDRLVEKIDDILTENEFSPSHLKFEITESLFFEHQERAVGFLNQFRAKGIEIHIDDFGTGYSNLGYLRQLPVTVLKVDRTFVSMIDEDGRNDEIVKAVVTMAINLGLRVIAEGVETEAQRTVLKDLGCNAAQGYLFAAPMPLSSLREYLIKKGIAPGIRAPADDFSEVLMVQ
jgi:diguanylate cyclase (GGDEF)-like protein/PAS domain S-box-containing protein